MGAPTTDVLLATAWGGPITEEMVAAPGSELRVTHYERAPDWSAPRRKRVTMQLADGVRIAKQGESHDAIVLVTAGLPTVLAALAWRAWRRPPALVVLDLLFPQHRTLDRALGRLLGRMDAFVCIRSGDIATIGRRFGFPQDRCHFLRMPSLLLGQAMGPGPGPGTSPYAYCAGDAHRDWDLLVRALSSLPYTCVLTTRALNPDAPGLPPNLDVRPSVEPDEGRALMRQASVVVLPFQDTELASGPTIVVDAMALGKPVVATATNACRDYISHGDNGFLSSPGDAADMARHLRDVMEGPALAARLGQAARAFAERHLQPEDFARDLSVIVNQAIDRRRALQGDPT